MKKKYIFIKSMLSYAFLLFALLSVQTLEAQFTPVAGAKGLNDSSGGNINGHAWGDVDNDGDLDVVFFVLGSGGGSNARARLFINSGAPNYTFSDSTLVRAAGLNDDQNFGRQILIVDFNNDGYNDILRGFGSSRKTEIFYNDGPPHYTFGDATQQPDVELGAPGDGQEWNTEGIAAIDWNQDGWLDVIIDNDAGGNDVYENDKVGGFTYISPGTSAGQTGFPASHSGDGDFMTVADIDDDGYVDLYGRKTAVSNYWWFNPATSRFQTQVNPNIVSSEADKGGTMFCDFDGDGDLDLFWTSNGNNEIWRNDGGNVWTATGIPAAPIRTQSDIDGCDCGDYDNDGDVDIVLGASSGNSYLLENTTTGGTLSFSSGNLAVNDNTESVTFSDYDNDGDLDLYFLVDGGANQLWENSTNNRNYLFVNALFENGDGSTRDAIGANIILRECSGDTLCIKQVNGGKGHGSQHQKKVHFGLNPFLRYVAEVHYVYKNGTRNIVRKAVIPMDVPTREISIVDTDTDDFDYCNDIDNDGVPDLTDIDDDNDGTPDVKEICGAAATDYSCLSSVLHDGGGNALDPGGDEDADGVLNYEDADDPGVTHASCTDGDSDGICDAVNPLLDRDGDGLPNSMDLDADNDGISDLAESKGVDTNGDGSVDGLTDADGDRIPDTVDADDVSCVGGDNDSPPDGICDAAQGGTDTDGDGIQDTDDADADGDGLPDVYDSNSGGVDISSVDTDGDRIPDSQDLDADNDGIPDVVEAGGTDTDGDGLLDGIVDTDADGFSDQVDGDVGNDGPENTGNSLQATGTDTNNDGVPNSYPEGDQDSDGVLDQIDLDADNDGIQDIVEAGGSDENGDGMIGNYIPLAGLFTGGGDADNDGFSSYYDSDTNNDGTTGDAGTNPMVLTTADGDNDGAPDSGFNSGDMDEDGLPNHMDLDADNDGITDVRESGVTDENNDGIADDALTNDSDGNGWSNSYDGENGGIEAVSTTDSDSDGLPDSYDTQNKDADMRPNFLDIDADNDGLVDNTEGQATHAYQAPDDKDSDGDGIDDAYDTIVGYGGAGIAPENTDSFEDPDYLDLDTDNDGKIDAIEGHDTNGDGVVDGLDTPSANTGLPGAGADIDNDGLIDGYDNSTSSPNPTNTSLDPNSHPDQEVAGVDRDWRQARCVLCKVEYSIQDGNGTQTTNHIYDSTLGLLKTTANTYGTIRTNRYCLIDGWRYYYNPANPSEALFAVRGDSLDLDLIDYIDIRVGQTSGDREAGQNSVAYTRLMNRDWSVELSGSLSAPVDIRFYYPGDDFGANGYQVADTNADGFSLGDAPGVKWFSTSGWDTFDPTTVNADGSNVRSLPNFMDLFPAVNADKVSGSSETDGTTSTVGNAKNFVQFDGLTSLDGGTAAWGAGSSSLPVNLTHFYATSNGCETQVVWNSETEENFSHYDLEWSGNGINYTLIKTINGSGGAMKQTYQYVDESASIHNYYRLKMVDVDGSYEYSNVIYIETDCLEEYDISVYPNPVGLDDGMVNIKFFAEREETTLEVTDLMGQRIKVFSLGVEKEWNTIRLDISDLPVGTYFVKFPGNRGASTFIIQE